MSDPPEYNAANDSCYNAPPVPTSSDHAMQLLHLQMEQAASLAVRSGLYSLYSPSTRAMFSRALRSLHTNLPGLGVMPVGLAINFNMDKKSILLHVLEIYRRLDETPVDFEDCELLRITVREATQEEQELAPDDHEAETKLARYRMEWYMQTNGVSTGKHPNPHFYLFCNLLNDARLFHLRIIHSVIGNPSRGLGTGQTFKFCAVSAFRYVEVEFNMGLAQSRFLPFMKRTFERADRRRAKAKDPS